MANYVVLDHMDYCKWDELLSEHPSATIFQTSAWLKVLEATYRYKPMYVVRQAAGGPSAIMPIMEVSSMLTGNRGVSLPFTDICEPLFGADDIGDELIYSLRRHGREKRWDYFEIRGGTLANEFSSATYYSHSLDLSQGIQRIAAQLRESTARNIKAADKNGITIDVSDSSWGIQQFVRLNDLSRREHGLPPQPRRFFHNVYEHIHSQRKGLTIVALHQKKPVAAAVFLHYRDQAVYKYGAFNRAYQHLRANNRIMWSAVEWYATNGFKSLSFGRTELENEGLLQFKRGWGAVERPVNYYRYDLRRDTFVSSHLAVAGAHTTYFRHMPMPLLKLAGTLLYRHMG